MATVSPTKEFLHFCGAALMAGGVLTAAVNALLTPMLPPDGGTVAVATSRAFALRMPLAALSVALVTVGSVGLYLAQARRLRFGKVAFVLAGAGGLLAFWAEVVQMTLLRDLAFAAPETLEALESAGDLVRYDVTFPIAVGAFALGWIGVALVTLTGGILPRRGATTLLAGVVLLPILGGVAGVWGAAVGNLVLGGGWALLGSDLRRAAAHGPTEEAGA